MAILRRHVPQLAVTEEEILAFVGRGATAHPEVVLGDQAFLEHVGPLIAARGGTSLARLFAEDLYLAFACAAGDPAALRTLDQLLPRVASAVARVDPSPDFIADALQHLRLKLLLHDADRPPGILAYAGRGPLVAWLRVAAVRTATDLLRQDARFVTLETDAGGAPAGRSADPELRFLKQEGAQAIEAALARTLGVLGDRDRTLLRLHLVERMPLATLGRIYHVHETTMARRLQALRAELVDAMKRDLDLDSAELASKFALVESQLDVHLERYLSVET
jgi:RNA polymerase sigma-70 factor (ECF subfamily)